MPRLANLPKKLRIHNSNHRHQFCQNLVVTKDSGNLTKVLDPMCAVLSNLSRAFDHTQNN